MLKWLVVLLVVVVLSALAQFGPGRGLRIGELPGDLRLRVGKRTLRLPFTSTVLMSLCAWLLLRAL